MLEHHAKPGGLTPEGHRIDTVHGVFDASLDAVISIEASGRVILWNTQARNLFGWRREEICGRMLAEAMTPEDLLDSSFMRMIRGEEQRTTSLFEMEFMDRERRRIKTQVSVIDVRLEHADAGFTLFIRDMRPSIERQRKLEVSDERLQRVLNGASQGFWDIDLRGEGSALSSRCSTMLGYESGALANSPPDMALELHPDDHHRVRTAWMESQEPGSAGFEVQYRLLAADHTWRWMHDVGEVVARDESGRATRIVGTRTDFTDRHYLEEALQSSQKLECLGVVASGFAHDLNNILAVISGHASLAGEVDPMPDRLVESLGVIQLAVTRARSLTENMMALGRPSDLFESEVSVCESVAATCSLMKPSFPGAITMKFKCNVPPSARVRVDSSQFQQSLVNLILNARDALDGEGTIHVTTQLLDDTALPWVRIEVRDDGVGIEESDREHIFKPFFTTKPPGEGTGIGLSVVDGFVKAAKGRIQIESAPGEGTTFQIDLPLMEPAEATESSDGTRHISGSARVLLVEDHSMLRPMLAEAIAAGGHEVTAFGSFAATLESELVRDDAFDVCVIDVNLTDGNGVDLADRIEERIGHSIPTIFSTGNPDSVVLRDLKSWQVLMRKPFDIDVLLQRIKSMAGMQVFVH